MATVDQNLNGLIQPPSKSTENLSYLNSIMATGFRWRKGWLAFLGGALVLMVLMIYVMSMTSKSYMNGFAAQPFTNLEKTTVNHMNYFWVRGYTTWPEFSNKPFVTNEYFKTICVKDAEFSITGLSPLSVQWGSSPDDQCLELFKKFDAIFKVDARKAYLNIPPPFKSKVANWLGNKPELVKEVYNQDVIHMISKFTREHTIFNPLRDKRPVSPPDTPEQKYVNDIVNKTAATCDFCKFRDMTAEHVFGRVESQYSFSASNVFKIDSLHALVGLKSHHPLNWNHDMFMDLMGLTVSWLNKAKKHYSKGKYPSLIWDVLPKCGASQVHPHIHVMLDPERYHGVVEGWRQAAQDYHNSFGSNYFTDLVSIYSALGLTVTHGNATAFANMVPKKDHEVVVMAKEADEDFFNLLYYTIRAFVDDLHVFCYSLGLGYPGLGASEGKIPAFARIITRGAVTDIRTDMSSLELFTATNVNIDPWKTIQVIRDSVQKRGTHR